MIFPSLEGKLFQLCLKSDIFPTLTPNTNKISTQTKKCKISQLWPKNANFFNSDQNMHAMYALMTSLVLSFVHLMGVRPVQTYCWKKVWTSHLPSPTYNVIICQLFFAHIGITPWLSQRVLLLLIFPPWHSMSNWEGELLAGYLYFFLRHWICFQDPLWEFVPPLVAQS